MPSTTRHLRLALLATLAIAALALLVGGVVRFLYPDDWRAVEATVQTSHIKRTRLGTLQWALLVDTIYEVNGHTYQTTSDVFHDPDLSVIEAQVSKWPTGRTLTLYFNAKDPGSVSLVPDGGREATIVTAVILTPLVVFMIGFIVLLVRRLRANNDDSL